MSIEPFANHQDCDIEAQCEVWETFRTQVEDGVLHIVKNVEYEVVDTKFFCNDHCVNVEVEGDDYEWSA